MWAARRVLALVWALLPLAPARPFPRGNCGVEIPHPPDAGRAGYHSVGASTKDLDDELWTISPGDTEFYEELLRECQEPLDRDRCRAFGVRQWNLSSPYVVALEGRSHGKRLCKEDRAVLEQMEGVHQFRCNMDSVMCRQIGNEVRLVGLRTSLLRHDAELLKSLPHLFSLVAEGAVDDLSGVELPESLRVVSLRSEDLEAAVTRLAPLLRRQGRIQSLGVFGPQHVRKWQKLDLSHFCGLETLRRFNSYTVNVGQIPECWGRMQQLESFYCTSCMLTAPPAALRGLQSLRSFVAFRQSEMVPCLAKELEGDIGPCKASWETTMKLKVGGRDISDGTYGDFQNGPSYLCQKEAYAFPFREFLSLDWPHIEKVWLDGNFLTGEIPEDIDKAWPSLQSLDLYENSMHGEIPESLVGLDFVKLQLNGNNFSGTLPKGLSKRLKEKWNSFHLGVAGNPELEGCLHIKHGIAQTRLRTCERDEL